MLQPDAQRGTPWPSVAKASALLQICLFDSTGAVLDYTMKKVALS